MVRWIAGSINPENFETWQSLVQPYETEFMASVAATYDAETLPSVRNGQALFLSDFHKKEIDKLLDYVARAQPNELSIWSKAIAQCTEKPSEAVLVDWKLFDELDGAERLSENDCVEQANRVLIQWLLGDADCFREALRQRPDPRLRTYVVHRSVAVGIQVDEMLQQLFVEKESDICYGLLLILGLMDGSSLESSLRKKCKAWLIDNYQHHPDSGVHAMCRILLDRWQWTLDRKKVDEALIVAAPPGKSNKSWFVNRLGMHFTVVSAPVDFWMGGKQDKNSPYDFNPKRFERIDRSYAIAMDHADFSILTQFKPDFQSHRFSWNQGLDFCRWLNQNEQYSDIDLSVFSEPDGMDQLGNYVGYRLPTSEEWEFAAKGYASTICHFGTTKTAHYSSFRRSDEDQAIPFPNRLGLTGLGDYAEPTNTLFPINPKMVLLRGSRISSSLAGRSETEATPSSRDGISSTFRLRVVLVLPNY